MSKLSQRKQQLFASLLPEFIEYLKQVKGLQKNNARSVKGDHFEQMEKIHFLLEQEGYELEQLLQDTVHSKDEIDAFLHNKINTKLVHSSGAFKILETIVFSNVGSTVNYDALLKLVDKKIEFEIPKVSKKKEMIHDITRNILEKIQKAQQKKIKDQSIFTLDYYKSNTHKIDLSSLTLDKEVQTDDEEDRLRTKSVAVRKYMKNKEIDNYTKDLELYNEEILRKCHNFELQKNSAENEKNNLIMNLKQIEIKLKNKKEKNRELKQLVIELKEKLAEFSEKAASNLNNFKNKEKDYEKLVFKMEESQTTSRNQLNEIALKNETLEKRIREIKINNKIDERSLSLFQNTNSILNEENLDFIKENHHKKSHPKKKRASTIDYNNIFDRLTKNKPLLLTSHKNDQKDNNPLESIKRSKSVYVSNKKPRQSITRLKDSTKIESSSEKNPLKSLIDSTHNEKELQPLIEDSEDSDQDSDLSEEIEKGLKIDIIKQRPQTQEMAINTKALEYKEKETTANFIDKTELYLNKLRQMIERDNQKMRYIIEKIFLHRNHQIFINDMVNFLKTWLLKKFEKFTQTEDFIFLIKPISNLKDRTGGDNANNLMKPSQTSRTNDLFGKSTSRMEEIINEIPRVKTHKTQKSQSQHIINSKSIYFDRRPHLLNNNSEEKKEKIPINSSFLFNKAVKGDVFNEINNFAPKYSEFEQLISKKKPVYEELMLNIDFSKEKAEEIEKEKLIKRLSEHIYEIQKKDMDNFAKIKHFFKYPFKTVKEIVGNTIEIGFEDGRIEVLIEKFINKHRVCGENCKHLKRFYQRIGFINIQNNRKEAHINRQFINKLPNVNEM